MHHQADNEIKYRPDGSIDTAYYMRVGRAARADQAHKLAKDITHKARLSRRWRIFPLSLAPPRHTP